MQSDDVGVGRRYDGQMKREHVTPDDRDRTADAIVAGIAELEFVGTLQAPPSILVASEADFLYRNRPVEQLHAFRFAGPARALQRDIARAQAVLPEPRGEEEYTEDREF